MIFNFNKISNDIQEILESEVLAKEISFAVERIKSILNNPFISNSYVINTDLAFSSVEVDGVNHLALNINGLEIHKGMILSIHKTKMLDGNYMVKDIQGEQVIFENEAPIENLTINDTGSVYVVGLPFGSELVIAKVIDENRIHMVDSAGVSSVGQGSDSKSFKMGSTIRNYITTQLDGHFMQPGDGTAIMYGFLNLGS